MIVADIPDELEGPLDEDMLTQVKHVIPVEQSKRAYRHHRHQRN
jgi:hypothetical protein